VNGAKAAGRGGRVNGAEASGRGGRVNGAEAAGRVSREKTRRDSFFRGQQVFTFK